jgi:hypothetical protein
LIEFDKNLGGRSVIPSGTKKFIENNIGAELKGEEKTKTINKILGKWIRTINATTIKIWKNRYKDIQEYAETIYEIIK